MLDAVAHEFALRSPVGAPAAMGARLRHLALIIELPTVTLRVLPASIFATEMGYGGFSVLDFVVLAISGAVHDAARTG